jgi:hypothetical protein
MCNPVTQMGLRLHSSCTSTCVPAHTLLDCVHQVWDRWMFWCFVSVHCTCPFNPDLKDIFTGWGGGGQWMAEDCLVLTVLTATCCGSRPAAADKNQVGGWWIRVTPPLVCTQPLHCRAAPRKHHSAHASLYKCTSSLADRWKKGKQCCMARGQHRWLPWILDPQAASQLNAEEAA